VSRRRGRRRKKETNEVISHERTNGPVAELVLAKNATTLWRLFLSAYITHGTNV
jgi:hypothetical protein